MTRVVLAVANLPSGTIGKDDKMNKDDMMNKDDGSMSQAP